MCFDFQKDNNYDDFISNDGRYFMAKVRVEADETSEQIAYFSVWTLIAVGCSAFIQYCMKYRVSLRNQFFFWQRCALLFCDRVSRSTRCSSLGLHLFIYSCGVLNDDLLLVKFLFDNIIPPKSVSCWSLSLFLSQFVL